MVSSPAVPRDGTQPEASPEPPDWFDGKVLRKRPYEYEHVMVPLNDYNLKSRLVGQ